MIKSPQELEHIKMYNGVLTFLEDNFEEMITTPKGGSITIPSEWNYKHVEYASKILVKHGWEIAYINAEKDNAFFKNNKSKSRELKIIPLKILTQEEYTILVSARISAVSNVVPTSDNIVIENMDEIKDTYPSFNKEEEKAG